MMKSFYGHWVGEYSVGKLRRRGHEGFSNTQILVRTTMPSKEDDGAFYENECYQARTWD